MADGQVVFEISADGKKAYAAINDVTEALKKAGIKWESDTGKSTENIGNKFVDMFKKISVAALAMKAGKALLDFGKDAIQAASDLEEVQNVVDVTFGAGNSKIENWAKNAAAQFGLTELQAKKFTSTLGAMMKSAGLAGPEIEDMSTNLAGLAADMASFYNMDFDTAFMKIRSGISGETEPLKQLGINMSVANLEAYALTQGITKAFNSMSQGEQTMLRYQYLMQATADAQGDFARTSDGLANTQRRLETAIETLKTKLGAPFLGVVASATSALADFVSSLVGEKPRTILDEINDIQIAKEQKLADIKAIADEAKFLLATMTEIGNDKSISADSNVVQFVQAFTEKLNGLDTATQGAGTMKTNIGLIAEGLSAELGGDPTKWTNLLTAIKSNAADAIAATQGDSTKTKAFLENVAAGADDLTTDYSAYWNNLLSVLGDEAEDAIRALAGGNVAGTALGSIAAGANDLGLLAGSKWSSFVEALGGITSSTGTNLQGVATALSTKLGGDADKWKNLLSAIAGNARGAIDAIGDNDGSATKAFLANVAESADDLTTDYSNYWSLLLGALGDKAAGAISALAGGDSAGSALEGIATGANGLKSSTGNNWQGFVEALGGLTKSTGTNLQTVANALATQLGGDADKWRNLLVAIKQNAKGAIDAIGDNDGSKTRQFLQNVAASADDLTTDYSSYWSSLLGALGDNAGKAIRALADGDTAGTNLGSIANGANDLSGGAGNKWQGFVDAIGGLTGKKDVPATLSGVADALAKNIGGKSGDWEKLLKAVGNNLDKVTTAASTDGGQTSTFLTTAAEAAAKLGSGYADLWESLLIALGTNAGAAVEALKDATNVGTNLGNIANGANALTIGKTALWSALLVTLKGVDGLENIFDSTAAGNVSDLAKALSGNSPEISQAEAWKTFLGALQTNPDALTVLTKTNADQTAEWLKTVAEQVNAIDPTDAQAWNTLLSNFVSELPGLNDTQYGATFFEAMKNNFLAMGSDSDVAAAGLRALGYSTEEITDMQGQWLSICKLLVQKMPELNSLINTQTGAVTGGAEAVSKYIEAWQSEHAIQAQIESIKKLKAAIEQELNYDWELEVAKKRSALYASLRKQGLSETDAAKLARGDNGLYDILTEGEAGLATIYDDDGAIGRRIDLTKESVHAFWDLTNAEREYREAQRNNQFALETFNQELADLEAQSGKTKEELLGMGEANQTAAENASALTKAANGEEEAMKSVETAVKKAEDALKALADYQEKVRSETESTVRSVINGFSQVETPLQKLMAAEAEANKKINEAKTKEEKEAATKAWQEAKNKLDEGKGQVSVAGMRAGLESQLKYMQEYKKNLDIARQKGVSEDILATLSDGSQESFDYLYAIANYGGDIDDLNAKYKAVQEEAESFTDTLTEQKLVADKEFKSLVQNVQDAVGGLDLGETTKKSVSETLQGIIDACGDKQEGIKTAVDGIEEQMKRLRGLGYGAFLTSSGYVAGRSSVIAPAITEDWGSSANGMDYVPYDGYLALLHQGERIQTAAEADLARRYSYQQPAFDYSAMGGAIGANIGRGNVYLDGRTVGEVLSSRQANSYRALERSGWQG